jgi:hypothetical protein
MKKGFLSLMMVVFCVVLFTETSKAIPAFARKYKTSCATCHNGFPKLTAFGEAFRRNGYQFPGGSDAEFTKEDPVSLGSDGNKRAFPDAIWPGSIPGSSPISLFFNSEADYNPKVDPRFTFGELGSSIEAVAAGTFGEDLSFWGHAILNGDGTLELNRIFLTFSSIVGEPLALNARVGAFEPGLFSFSTHRAWSEGYWITTRPFSEDMGWSIEEFQKGIELNGVLQNRFGYNAGMVEGYGAAHANKDYYAHVTYKFLGLPLDGVTSEGPALNSPKPYIDNSVTVGAFVYSGSADIGADSMMQSNKFSMVGGDVNASYDRLNLFGGIGIRNDKTPFVGDTLHQSANTTVWFGEADVVIYPWLLAALRYESWKSSMLDPEGAPKSYNDKQFVPGLIALVRPNVKIALRTTIAKSESLAEKKFEVGQVALTISFGL